MSSNAVMKETLETVVAVLPKPSLRNQEKIFLMIWMKESAFT